MLEFCLSMIVCGAGHCLANWAIVEELDRAEDWSHAVLRLSLLLARGAGLMGAQSRAEGLKFRSSPIVILGLMSKPVTSLSIGWWIRGRAKRLRAKTR